MEMTASRVSAYTDDVDRLAPEDLLKRYVFIAHAHQLEAAKNKELQMKMEALQENLIQVGLDGLGCCVAGQGV